jgi:hypothetical protein
MLPRSISGRSRLSAGRLTEIEAKPRSSCDWPGPRTTVRRQRRLNRFLTSCPESISVKDSLVSGMAVAGLPLAATGVFANGFWLAATLGVCRLMTFGLG